MLLIDRPRRPPCKVPQLRLEARPDAQARVRELETARRPVLDRLRQAAEAARRGPAPRFRALCVLAAPRGPAEAPAVRQDRPRCRGPRVPWAGAPGQGAATAEISPGRGAAGGGQAAIAGAHEVRRRACLLCEGPEGTTRFLSTAQRLLFRAHGHWRHDLHVIAMQHVSMDHLRCRLSPALCRRPRRQREALLAGPVEALPPLSAHFPKRARLLRVLGHQRRLDLGCSSYCRCGRC
mmetsp:Transcript_77959/g.215542  ORF Transcript_77959/g.215542 Transcript_77959/m.215542 type:complete len:236 (-) Transcript_77959:348-1055(-)